MKNECKKCNCNNHSQKCKYDSRVFAVSGLVVVVVVEAEDDSLTLCVVRPAGR